MPDESCRKCGGLLLEYEICAQCRHSIQFMCRMCAHKTIERNHDGFCFNLRKPEPMIPKFVKVGVSKGLISYETRKNYPLSNMEGLFHSC